MSKYYKGYNGRRRKMNRMFSQVLQLHIEGASFADMYPLAEKTEALCIDVPNDDLIHNQAHEILSIIRNIGHIELDEQLLADYWGDQ